jgi:hypothetical protein
MAPVMDPFKVRDRCPNRGKAGSKTRNSGDGTEEAFTVLTVSLQVMGREFLPVYYRTTVGHFPS